MCDSYVLQNSRSKFNNTQINPKCLLCGNAEETAEHYILTCETLEKFRNPKLTNISEIYLNFIEKEYMILDTRSKLQIIIDCSVLVSQESILNKKTEDTGLIKSRISCQKADSCATYKQIQTP